MRTCSHHYSEKDLNVFHYEGCIWSHSCMVTKELEGSYLEIAGVLHDIGKVSTRYENHEKKRVRFFGHENMSAFMSLSIFKDWRLSQEDREFLFQLIALHGEPYRLTQDEMNSRLIGKEYLAQSLYLFGLADHKGRFHEGEDKHVHNEFSPASPMENEFTKEVVFLIGLPGSGKTTYIEKNLKNYTVVSRDNLVMKVAQEWWSKNSILKPEGTYNDAWAEVDQKEVDRRLQAELQRASVLESKVVIDMTNLTRKQRLQKLRFFKDFKKKAIVLLPDLLTTFKRLEERPGKTIGEDVIKQMIMGFSPSGLDEFDSVEYIFE